MDFSGKRITVMGLGRFGGGVGVTRYLADRGADVLVTDAQPAERLEASVGQLRDLIDRGQVTLRLGQHNVSDFTTVDLVVVNPAVDPRDNRFLRAAAAAEVPLTSEIRLLVQALPSRERVIGVTGSAGKSTVTAMIGHALEKLAGTLIGPGDSRTPAIHVGGNLGGSLLPRLGEIQADDWVVLELSSFMLEGLDQDRWSPHIAVVTSLAPNHLDRHGTFEQYVAAKQSILEHQTLEDRCVLGPGVAQHMRPMAPQAFISDEQPIDLPIPGGHNQVNARLAVAACGLAGASVDEARAVLSDFAGLPHRLQLVSDRGGIRFFNDSKSTTPEAARLAIESFEPGVVHAILGGYDKGSDLAGLAQCAARHCRGVYTIGATGPAIAGAMRQIGGAETVECTTLEQAMTEIASRLHPGDVVLLSPGCASWDQFEHFEQRGEAFTSLVPRLNLSDT